MAREHFYIFFVCVCLLLNRSFYDSFSYIRGSVPNPLSASFFVSTFHFSRYNDLEVLKGLIIVNRSRSRWISALFSAGSLLNATYQFFVMFGILRYLTSIRSFQGDVCSRPRPLCCDTRVTLTNRRTGYSSKVYIRFSWYLGCFDRTGLFASPLEKNGQN